MSIVLMRRAWCCGWHEPLLLNDRRLPSEAPKRQKGEKGLEKHIMKHVRTIKSLELCVVRDMHIVNRRQPFPMTYRRVRGGGPLDPSVSRRIHTVPSFDVRMQDSSEGITKRGNLLRRIVSCNITRSCGIQAPEPHGVHYKTES